MKTFILLILFMCLSVKGFSEPIANVSFSVGVIVKSGTYNPFPKSPNDPPTATLEDNMLTFTSEHADYTLTLLDEEGETIYTTYVSSSVNVVVLPATLTGNYELRLIPDTGNYYFYGEIIL